MVNEPLQTSLRGIVAMAVATAAAFARRLVELEVRRTGVSINDAIAPVARRVKTSKGTVWGLLFRRPKVVSADLLAALQAAVIAELKREIGSLENELEATSHCYRRPDSRTLAEIQAGIDRLRERLRDLVEGES